MAAVAEVLDKVADWVWGPWFVALLFGTHLFLTVRLRFMQRYLGRAIRLSFSRKAEGEGDAQALAFRTNVEDWVVAGTDHPLRFEIGAADGVKPYVRVRGRLWARLARPLLYDLVELGEERIVEDRPWFGVGSAGAFFPMAPADALPDSVKPAAASP